MLKGRVLKSTEVGDPHYEENYNKVWKLKEIGEK